MEQIGKKGVVNNWIGQKDDNTSTLDFLVYTEVYV